MPHLYNNAIQLGEFPDDPNEDQVAEVMALVSQVRGGDWSAERVSGGFWVATDRSTGTTLGGTPGRRTRDFPTMVARCGVAVVIDLPYVQ